MTDLPQHDFKRVHVFNPFTNNWKKIILFFNAVVSCFAVCLKTMFRRRSVAECTNDFWGAYLNSMIDV